MIQQWTRRDKLIYALAKYLLPDQYTILVEQEQEAGRWGLADGTEGFFHLFTLVEGE